MASDYQAIGRAFARHRDASDRQRQALIRLKRITDEIEQVQTVVDSNQGPEVMANVAARATQTLRDDTDVVAIFSELAEASREVARSANDLGQRDMGRYLKGKT